MATAEPEVTPNTPNSEEEQSDGGGREIVSPEDYIKHPLQNRWALWFFKNDKSKTWQANLRLISKFDTVEDFWAKLSSEFLLRNPGRSPQPGVRHMTSSTLTVTGLAYFK
ncbi:hypothetical protein AMELA_G00009520 [Ameiurus melas]|uniref:Eukaryotic translation initiation factor 4E n=1 Tax=Ameiurus melas TaxID=219545 RepID=A0A7J6BG86_AMEME|nr:hypothetical protein AMELA_G00009520 [Ameiurus melas]